MPEPRPFGVLWDVDGTLVDTGELHFRAWQELARRIGREFTREDFAGTFGWRNAEIVPKIFGPEADSKDLGDRKEALYREEAARGVALLPGVEDLLEGLPELNARQAIGSSAPRANIDLILEVTQTDRWFAAVVSAEDTTRGKPDPEVFLLGAQRLGLDPASCVVIEDAPVGVQAAKRGGFRAVGVTFVGHHSADSLKQSGADLVVASLEEVTPERIARLLRL